jgi:transposase
LKLDGSIGVIEIMSKDASSSLPSDVAILQKLLLHERDVVASMSQTISEQQRKLQQQEHRLAQLLRQFYGPRGERFNPDQLTLFDAAELTAIAQETAEPAAAEESASARPRQPGHGRRSIPAGVPRETISYELTAQERLCPGCGELRSEIGRERSEQLEYIPPQYKVLVHERVKYACRKCQEQVAVAAKPPQPVEKGLPGPGLLAHTVLAKYGDHAPLYRQEDVHARHGIILRRSTLCDWIAAAADLVEPLYRRMGELVLESRIIWTDDTTVKLLDPLLGRARTARFWAYLGDPRQPYSVYDFTDSRSRDGPQSCLQGYRGYLQADAYGGYDGIYAGGQVVEVACWAHARRKWHEARTSDPVRSHQALALIQRLYEVEEDCRQLQPEPRRAVRQERSLPLLAEFRAWLDESCADALPKSPIGQAAVYARNQWQALVRYCEDGELSIDNNAGERAMKVPALGRKNWIFVASRAGGRRAAILFSLVASCKVNQVEPWAYLRDLFSRLPALPSDSPELLDPLLPDRWLLEHPQHRWVIDDLRRTSRHPSGRRHGK